MSEIPREPNQCRVVYSHDPKCYELARYFLADEKDVSEERVKQLAQVIQDAIEDELEDPQ